MSAVVIGVMVGGVLAIALLSLLLRLPLQRRLSGIGLIAATVASAFVVAVLLSTVIGGPGAAARLPGYAMGAVVVFIVWLLVAEERTVRHD